MSCTVMGFRVIENNERGTVATVVYYTTAFSDYEKNSAEDMSGVKTGNEYIRGTVDVAVGDEVRFVYEKGFQDKAVCTGLEVIQSFKKPVDGAGSKPAGK